MVGYDNATTSERNSKSWLNTMKELLSKRGYQLSDVATFAVKMNDGSLAGTAMSRPTHMQASALQTSYRQPNSDKQFDMQVDRMRDQMRQQGIRAPKLTETTSSIFRETDDGKRDDGWLNPNPDWPKSSDQRPDSGNRTRDKRFYNPNDSMSSFMGVQVKITGKLNSRLNLMELNSQYQTQH